MLYQENYWRENEKGGSIQAVIHQMTVSHQMKGVLDLVSENMQEHLI